MRAKARTTLLEMFTYARPAGSKTEREFRSRWLLSLSGAWVDVFGNIHVTVGDSRTLFSSHTDTVHRESGRQRVLCVNGVVSLAPSEKRNCLGADDTVGVWIMREMILARRPGYYIFHHAEERGGIGSSDLASAYGDWLSEKFDHAIAFDRRGTSDVITHQAGLRCASETFALALAHELGGTYAPCDSGIFTDTANYTDYISECTNISVGYRHEHMSSETANIDFACELLETLLTLDTSTLPAVRDPRVVEYVDYGSRSGHGSYYGGLSASMFTADDFLDPAFAAAYEMLASEEGRPIDASEYEWDDIATLEGNQHDDVLLHKLVKTRVS